MLLGMCTKLPPLYATPETSSPNHTQPLPPIPLARRDTTQLRDETDMTSSQRAIRAG